MKFISLLCTLLLLMTFPTKSSADRPLEGCANPKAIAAMLSRIRDGKGQSISLERLRVIWPKELSDLECDSKSSRSVISHDRVIDGHCQCCATFSFNIQGTEDRAGSEQLNGIIINYSAPRRDELVRIAKRFASASGLKQAELKALGLGSAQSFQWETTRGKERRVYTLELRFTRLARQWELYFNNGWYTIEPASSKSAEPRLKTAKL